MVRARRLFAAVCCVVGVAQADVVVENAKFRLTLGDDAAAKSLVLKSSGEELLDAHERLPAFTVTQDRPFNNEIKLTYPNCETEFRANRVRRVGNDLIVGFELVPYEAKVAVRETDSYVLLELVDFLVGPKGSGGLKMTYPPVSRMKIANLPVRNRKNFGQWLNVAWDDSAAVALVAAEPYAWIEGRPRDGFRLLSAEARRDLKLRGLKAALVVSETDGFLDAMDAFERDLGLPRGVESRRSEAITRSVYWTSSASPATIDRHIALAKQGGFSNMLFYYTAIFTGAKGDRSWAGIGDYELGGEYANGPASLREMLAKIKAAGIRPGLHVMHTFVGRKTHYVTPVADPRLNLTCRFTLAQPLDAAQGGDVLVQEDPSRCPTNVESRVLRFGGELLSYEGFTTERPYRFTGVRRGHWDTRPVAHERGQIGGVLDVCEYEAMSCYIDQDSDLQDEIAEKIAKAYDCGFEFLYCDGSEGVNVPQGIHVPNAQYRVWKKLARKPLFMEGAAKAHFGWHHLSGANAFDIFRPEVFKAMIVRWPQYEAPLVRQDFSRIDFGWWGVWLPGKDTVGTQPDMWEFGTSRAAAWDCPAAIQINLDTLERHPRKDDLLEVMRRWEDVRAKRLLTPEMRERLKSSTQEHHLYLDERGAYELCDIEMLPPPEKAKDVRAFLFERKGLRTVAYWHMSGAAKLTVPFAGEVPLDKLRYLTTDLSKDDVRKAWSLAAENPRAGN